MVDVLGFADAYVAHAHVIDGRVEALTAQAKQIVSRLTDGH